MSECRRKLLIAEQEPNELFMLDMHLDTPNMYDSVSGFSVQLKSGGDYNTTYNCLHKKTGSVEAALLSLVNHPVKNFPSTCAANQFLEMRSKFLCANSEQPKRIVALGYGNNTAGFSWGGIGNYAYVTPMEPISLNKIYEWVFRFTPNKTRESILYCNDIEIWHLVNNISYIEYETAMSYLKSNSYVKILPVWYSPQSSNEFYIKTIQFKLVTI